MKVATFDRLAHGGRSTIRAWAGGGEAIACRSGRFASRPRPKSAAGAVALCLGIGFGVAGCASSGMPGAGAAPEVAGVSAAADGQVATAGPPAVDDRAESEAAGEAEVSAGVEAGASAEADSTSDAANLPVVGIYSEPQAGRGRAIFEEVCAECHTTGEFRGSSFQANWGRRTVYSLFRTVRSTMPDDNPGGLEETVYLDVVAYILRMNGHAAGPAELTADSPMRDVRIAPPDPGS